MCLSLGDALFSIDSFVGVLKETYIISIFSLLKIYYVKLKVTREIHAYICYCHLNGIRFMFVIEFYRTSLSDMLHVGTRGNGTVAVL